MTPTTPTLTILTGSSRGMGAAMAEQLLQRGDAVLGIARSTNDHLQALAAQHGTWLQQWSHDLGDARPAAAQLARWLEQQDPRQWREIRLINNVGVIPAIAPLDKLPADAITQGLRVGLESVMLITAAFLSATAAWKTPRKVLSISSGLGRRPMASQTIYCAAKAGIDHFSRCLALEEARKPHGARVCALAPGVIATDMQQQLRSADAADFPDRARFESLLARGELLTPQQAASHVLARLERSSFGETVIDDVRD
ncbi:short-chain dehydrogenase [Lampropedia cohaerens]|uniref:Short-chain dehydrogenase n=1 Tax=Lampropedia cohaerens TaxID=1610491 RepID=A0A0U1Q0B5_9BURK|nr:SDR family NAD(P)-dependent oxidoreductase [Lampropedia cohaerens]KKW68214.1 short-chain dehydrogenase [Lampropedia cohaerens]